MKRIIHKIPLDFSTRLYLWTTVLILVIFGGIAIIFHAYGTEREEELGQRYTGLLLNDMAHKIRSRVILVEKILNHYKQYITEDRLAHPDSLVKLVKIWVTTDPLVAGGSIAFEPYYYPDRGKYFMSYVTTVRGNKPVVKIKDDDSYNYHEMEWYKSAKEAGEPRWSEPYYDEGGADVMVVTYSLPLYDSEGKMFAVMTADMEIESLARDVSRLTPYPGSYTFMLSRNGTFIYHPDRRLILNETIFSFADSIQSESTRQFGQDMLNGLTGYDHRILHGSETIVNYTNLPGTGWSVGTVVPYDEVITHVGTFTRYMLLVLLVGLIIMLITMRFIIKRSTRPLDDLASAANKIAQGDFSTPLPEVNAKGSIRTLTRAFSHMQQSLSEYVASLKRSSTAQARIQSELDIAHRIQRDMIPRTFPTVAGGSGIDVFAKLNSGSSIGGDFYDFMIAQDKFYFCIGTVRCDSSVSSALLMAVLRSSFRSSISADSTPDISVKNMGEVLRNNPNHDMSSTLFVGVLNLITGELLFSNASHNAPILVDPDGNTEFLIAANSTLPLGVDVIEESTEESITLKPGSRMVFFTDGLINAANEGGAAYTDYTLYHIVTLAMVNHPEYTARQFVNSINRSVREHMGKAPVVRDQSIMSFTYTGRAPK